MDFVHGGKVSAREQENIMRALVVAASKYGSTFEYAAAVAGALGCGLSRLGLEPEPHFGGADVIVIGSPIYGPDVLPGMRSWLAAASADMRERELAAFVVCGDSLWMPRAGEGGEKNLAKLIRLLPRPPLATAVFGGRLRMDGLDPDDRLGILSFYRRLGREATGFDRVDLSAAAAFAGKIRESTTPAAQRCPDTD